MPPRRSKASLHSCSHFLVFLFSAKFNAQIRFFCQSVAENFKLIVLSFLFQFTAAVRWNDSAALPAECPGAGREIG